MQRKNNWFQRTMLTGRLNTNFFQSFSSLSESIISSVSWHALSLTWGTLAKWMIFLAELTFYRLELFILPTAIYCLEMRTFSCSNLDWFTLPLCTCKIQRFLVSLIRSMFYSFKKKQQQQQEMKFVGNRFQMRIQRLFEYFCRVQKWNSYKYNLKNVAKDSSHRI